MNVKVYNVVKLYIEYCDDARATVIHTDLTIDGANEALREEAQEFYNNVNEDGADDPFENFLSMDGDFAEFEFVWERAGAKLFIVENDLEIDHDDLMNT